jgi:hypothetical protein
MGSEPDENQLECGSNSLRYNRYSVTTVRGGAQELIHFNRPPGPLRGFYVICAVDRPCVGYGSNVEARIIRAGHFPTLNGLVLARCARRAMMRPVGYLRRIRELGDKQRTRCAREGQAYAHCSRLGQL